MHRNEDGLFYRPTQLESVEQKVLVYPNFFGPRSHALRLSVECKQSVFPAVSRLLNICCPPAITWLIISVIVFAVYGMFWAGTFAHVGKEILERVPPFANLYSTTTIIFISLLVLIMASKPHALPDPMRWRSAHAVGNCGFGKDVFNTPATFGVSRSQTTALNNGLVAAITATLPISSLAAMVHKGNDNQLGESFANKILEGPTRYGTIDFSHDGFTPLRLATDSGYNPFRSCFIIRGRRAA